jgi:serine/threonine-protein kinase
MAMVYEAIDQVLERRVAIKVIHPHLITKSQFAERFHQEARLVASLRHPHIVRLYDFDIQDEQPYMVMEFLEGGTLKDKIAELRSHRQLMPLGEVHRLVDSLSRALDYAHSRGAVHRDIKPANILFTAQDEPVISDFGIAKLIYESINISATGSVIGTPTYMSPEQASGAPLDGRSDQYSLGIMVYELVTGHVPFQAETPTGVILKHINESPPPLRSFNPSLPEPLQAAVLKSLEKDPARRFESCGAFVSSVATGLRGGVTIPDGAEPVTDLEGATVVDTASVEISHPGLPPLPSPAPLASSREISELAKPIRTPTSILHRIRNLPIRNLLLRTGIALFLLAGLILGAAWLNQRTSTQIPAKSVFTIAIADFDGSKATLKVDFARRIYEQLQNILADLGGELNITQLGEVIADTNAAQMALERQSATLLIWGWYDDLGVSPHVEVADISELGGFASPANPRIDVALVAGPDTGGFTRGLDLKLISQITHVPKVMPDFEFFVDNGSQQMAYITSAVLGLAYQVQGKPDIAEELYNRAIAEAPATKHQESQYGGPGLDLVYAHRAELKYDQGKLSDAVADLEQAVALNPGFYEAQYNLALLYPQICRPDRQLDPALEAAKAAAGLQPDDPAVHTLLASLLYQASDFSQAQSALQTALELDEHNVEALVLSGDVYSALRNSSAANQTYQRAVDLLKVGLASQPEQEAERMASLGNLYLRLDQPDMARSSFQAAAAAQPEAPMTHLGLGSLYFSSGEFDLSEQEYQAFARAEPDNGNALLLLGVAENLNGKPEQAIQTLQQAARLSTCDTAPLLIQGGIYLNQEQYEQAEQAFQDALVLEPGNADALYLLGSAYIMQDKLLEAQTTLEQAVAANGSLNPARRALGFVYSDTGQYPQAIEQYLAVVEAEPLDASAWVALGNAYEKIGDTQKAIEAYQRSLSLEDSASVHVYLALIYSKLGQFQQAEEQYLKALEVDNTDWLAYSGLGELYAAQGKLGEAEKIYQDASKMKEDSALYTLQAEVSARLGKLDLAADQYEQALQSGSENPQIRFRLAGIYSQGGMLQQAEQQYQTVLTSNPQDAQALAGLGYLAYKQCRLSDLSQRYLQAAQAAPTIAYYQSLPVYADEIAGNQAQAQQAYQALLADFPDDALIKLINGEFAQRNGDLDAAASFYQQVLESPGLAPFTRAIAHFNLGQVFLLQDRLAPAENEFARVLEDTPWHADALVALGDLALRQGDPAKAIQFYDQADLALPEYAWQFSGDSATLSEIGIILRRGIALVQDDADASRLAFNDALSKAQKLAQDNPGWPQAHILLGFAHALRGDQDLANTDYVSAGECDRSLQNSILFGEAALKKLYPP